MHAFNAFPVHVQHVCLGSRTELEVLKFAEDGFSFHWSKEGSRRQIKTTDDQPNTVNFQSVREEDFGHYQCEVKDAAAGKVLLTLYTALYKHQSSQLSNLKYPRFVLDPIFYLLYNQCTHSVYFLCPTITTELL